MSSTQEGRSPLICLYCWRKPTAAFGLCHGHYKRWRNRWPIEDAYRKVCTHCNEPFSSWSGTKQYCSKSCGNKHRAIARKEKGVCMECGKPSPSTSFCRPCMRHRHLMKKYKMSLDDYNMMLAAQEGLCLVCGKKDDILCVDHDHETGRVRGLLCNTCNVVLGFLEKKGLKAEHVVKMAKHIAP